MTADVKISALPATSTIGGSEIIPLVQGGVTSSATPSVLSAYFKANGNQGTVSSVNVSGGATGLTSSGGPITGVGTITLAGVLTTSAGGTNTTAAGTGTGGVVLSSGPTLNAPTFVSPILGVISSGVGTALTGVSLTTSITGTLTTGNGGTNTTTASTGSGGIVLATSPTLTTPTIATIKAAAATTSPAFQDSGGVEMGRLALAYCVWTGGTTTITRSFNVTSITRNGTGDYTINITRALPANPIWFCSMYTASPVVLSFETSAPSTTSARIVSANTSFNPADATTYFAVAF